MRARGGFWLLGLMPLFLVALKAMLPAAGHAGRSPT